MMECLKITKIGRNMLLKNKIVLIIYDKNFVDSTKFFYKRKVFRVLKLLVLITLKSTDK
jgi:hypothetical protein